MGEEDEEESTSVGLRKRIENSAMPEEAKDKAFAELKRMRAMSPMSQEGGLLKTYIDELLAIIEDRKSVV